MAAYQQIVTDVTVKGVKLQQDIQLDYPWSLLPTANFSIGSYE